MGLCKFWKMIFTYPWTSKFTSEIRHHVWRDVYLQNGKHTHGFQSLYLRCGGTFIYKMVNIPTDFKVYLWDTPSRVEGRLLTLDLSTLYCDSSTEFCRRDDDTLVPFRDSLMSIMFWMDFLFSAGRDNKLSTSSNSDLGVTNSGALLLAVTVDASLLLVVTEAISLSLVLSVDVAEFPRMPPFRDPPVNGRGRWSFRLSWDRKLTLTNDLKHFSTHVNFARGKFVLPVKSMN